MNDSLEQRLLGISTDAPELSDARRRVQAVLFGSAAPAASAERAEMIGRFTLLERLGAGGMGVVYIALDPELDRKVAIKILRPDHSESAAARTRLLREAQAIARLSHPNVITVYESGTYEDLVYIAMELVDGVDLRERCARAESVREVIGLFCDAARGLEAAHAVGLVHRDFKPENVMVGADGRVRVLDFGLARTPEPPPSTPVESSGATLSHPKLSQGAAEAPGDVSAETLAAEGDGSLLDRTLTRTGTLMGTPAYMAPEQFLRGTASPRSDIFSFCVALYEALYGARPYASTTVAELVKSLTRGVVQPAPEHTKVPARVRAVLLRGLQRDPDARYPSVALLRHDLERTLSYGPRLRRRLTTAALAGVALFVGYLGAGAPQPVDACAAAQTTMSEDVWPTQRQAKLAEAFATSGVPQAVAIWPRIHERVDAYVDAWTEGHAEACAAAQIATPQTERLAELREACLADARRELGATLDLLESADETIVFNGIQAIAELPAIERCADSQALIAAVAAPDDAMTAAATEAARARGAEIRARRRLGLYAPALEEIQALITDAAAIDYPPLSAELSLLRGQLEVDNARYDAAFDSFQTAFWTAVDAGHDEVTAAAATGLATIAGVRRTAIDEGLGWARQAEMLIRRHDLPLPLMIALEQGTAKILRTGGRADEARARLDSALERELAEGDDDLIVAGLLSDLGGVAIDQGQPDAAVEFLERSLARSRAALGDEHPAIGRALFLMGTAHYTIGRFTEALALFKEAQRILVGAYGPLHPEVGATLNNMGAAYDELRRLDDAEATYRRALEIRRAALGDDHPLVAATLDNLAYTLIKLGRLDEASEAMDQALSTLVAAHGEEHPEVGHSHLGQASLARRLGDLASSVEHAGRALAIYTATGGEDHPDVAYALIEIATSKNLSGDPEAAIEPARRALEIRSQAGLNPLLAAEARLRLGQALWLAGRDREAARGHFKAARAAYIAGEVPADELDSLDAWLEEHDVELAE